MNKEEILDEINKTKEHLANMEKILQECDYQRWKPKYDKPYWFVNPMGQAEITCNTGSTFHKLTVEYYNCFQTKEQAEQESEKILIRRQLEDIARRLNKEKKPDWIKCYQEKYYLGYDQVNSKITLEHRTTTIAQGTVYCLDETFRSVAIKEIGEGRLVTYLRGE